MGNLVLKQNLFLASSLCWKQRDKLNTRSEVEKESHDVASQPPYGSLSGDITLAVDNSSHTNYVCTNNLVILDAFQRVLEQRKKERVEAVCPANFKCECDYQHIMADFLGEANLLKHYLDQNEEEANSLWNTKVGLWISTAGGKMNFTILMRTKKGLQTCFTFGSSDHFASDCPSTFTLHPMLCTGMPFYQLGYKRGVLLLVHRRLTHCTLQRSPLNAVTIFAKPSECMFSGFQLLGSADGPYTQMPDDREKEGTWSSLPVLLLWMIKDKLYFFDNMRLAAVCRDWWSASASYPKRIQSVGDGLPWIWQVSTDFGSSLREFISVTREEKFIVDLPEFQEAAVLFSKQGWILLRRKNFSEPKRRFRVSDSLVLINPFTRGKIKLPDVSIECVDCSTLVLYAGSFSTCEGYPHCVVLLKYGNPNIVTISTAYPGDEVWTDHTYFGQRTVFSGYSNLITIGQNVYCYDALGKMKIYNMASHSWKELSGSEKVIFKGFITEHDGEIVKIERGDFNFSSFKVFRYDDANTAWERLNDDAVRDTSWFLCTSRNCFSKKEKGLKVYFLCSGVDRVGLPRRYYKVVSHDLITGSTQTLHLPYPVGVSATWVDIG